MKRRILTMLLALMMAVSLLAIPAAADGYAAYTDAVKAAIAENGDEYPGYGMLYDLDGDGSDELLMMFRGTTKQEPDVKQVVMSVYTLEDGAAVALMDHRGVFTEVGGNSGAAYIVKQGDKILLQVQSDSPEDLGPGENVERVHVVGEAERFMLVSGMLASVSRVQYDRVDLISAETGETIVSEEDFHCTERTASGNAPLTVEQYNTWMQKAEKLTALAVWDSGMLEDGLPLELLLGRLEGRIGAFTDVPSDKWYSESVEWALLHNVTNGTTDTTFSPDETCTRAQMVTFLWRAHGSPLTVEADDGGELVFEDVPVDAYYYHAVRWAVTRGITNGVSETRFAPDDTVTRGQTVTFLWRDAAHRSAAVADFLDVPQTAYYAPAVGWAEENRITEGMTESTFEPNGPCTRAQIVTFLSRAMCTPGLHVADVTGLQLDREPDYKHDPYGKEILFWAVGDIDDLAFTAVMFTEDGELLPDVTVHEVGFFPDGERFLLVTGIPDVAANLAVTYTIGDRTVSLAIQDSGLDGSLYLTEL